MFGGSIVFQFWLSLSLRHELQNQAERISCAHLTGGFLTDSQGTERHWFKLLITLAFQNWFWVSISSGTKGKLPQNMCEQMIWIDKQENILLSFEREKCSLYDMAVTVWKWGWKSSTVQRKGCWSPSRFCPSWRLECVRSATLLT